MTPHGSHAVRALTASLTLRNILDSSMILDRLLTIVLMTSDVQLDNQTSASSFFKSLTIDSKAAKPEESQKETQLMSKTKEEQPTVMIKYTRSWILLMLYDTFLKRIS